MDCYTNPLIHVVTRLVIQIAKQTRYSRFLVKKQNFPSQFMRLCIYALSCQLSYICFTSYHYINHWFIHLLYIFCMMNVVRMWQGNIVLRNISGVTEGVHWVRLHRCPLRKVALFKGIPKWNFLLPHFNFWPATEKCYNVTILTSCQNNS